MTIKKISTYVEILLLTLLTVGPFDPIYKIIGYVVLFIINYKSWKKIRFLKPFYILLLFSIVFPMIIDIKNVNSETPYSLVGFSYIAPFILGIIYIQKYRYEDFSNIVESVAFFSAICSIIGMFFVYFLPSVVYKFPTVYFYGRKVHTVGIFNCINGYNGLLHRNCGIAFEPGAFQFILNLGFALLLKKNIKNSERVIKSLIYIIAILLTNSTTGLVILAFLILKNSIKSWKSLLAFLLILFLLRGFIFNTLQSQTNKAESGNFAERFENTFYVLSNYGGNIFGIGSTRYNQIYKVDSRIGSWDTYTNLYVRFGLPFLILFLFLIFYLIKIDANIFIIVAFTLMTESLIGPITIIFGYYAIEKKKGVIDENSLDMQYSEQTSI